MFGKSLMKKKQKRIANAGGFAPMPLSGLVCLNDVADWQSSAKPEYADKLRRAKQLITDAELAYGKLKYGKDAKATELVNRMIDVENEITYILSLMEANQYEESK